jgi:hypothetical protein
MRSLLAVVVGFGFVLSLSAAEDSQRNSPHVLMLPNGDLKIYRTLEKKISYDFENRALKDVIMAIAKDANVNMHIHSEGLTDASVALTTRVSLHVQDVSLGAALRQLLRPIQLDYDVHHEVIKITSRKLREQEFTRIYPVADLLAVVQDGHAVVDFAGLAREIKRQVRPESWSERRGGASLRLFEERLALAIRQSKEGHEMITSLLRELREKRGRDVQLDCSSESNTGISD